MHSLSLTAAFLPSISALVLGFYAIATTAYSLSVKRMLLIDVLTLAGLYTVPDPGRCGRHQY